MPDRGLRRKNCVKLIVCVEFGKSPPTRSPTTRNSVREISGFRGSWWLRASSAARRPMATQSTAIVVSRGWLQRATSKSPKPGDRDAAGDVQAAALALGEHAERRGLRQSG